MSAHNPNSLEADKPVKSSDAHASDSQGDKHKAAETEANQSFRDELQKDSKSDNNGKADGTDTTNVGSETDGENLEGLRGEGAQANQALFEDARLDDPKNLKALTEGNDRALSDKQAKELGLPEFGDIFGDGKHESSEGKKDSGEKRAERPKIEGLDISDNIVHQFPAFRRDLPEPRTEMPGNSEINEILHPDGFELLDPSDWGNGKIDIAGETEAFLNSNAATKIDWLNEGQDFFNGDLNGITPGDFQADIAAFFGSNSGESNVETGQATRNEDGSVSLRQGRNRGLVSEGKDGTTHVEASTESQSISADVSADGRRVETNVNGDRISYDRDDRSATIEEMDITFDTDNNGIEGLSDAAKEHPGNTRVDNDGNIAHFDEHGLIRADGAGNITVGEGDNELNADLETEEEADERYRDERRRGKHGHHGRRHHFRNRHGEKANAGDLGDMDAKQLERFNLERQEDGSYRHTKTGRTFSINEDGRIEWNGRNRNGSRCKFELGRVDDDGNVTHTKTDEDGHTAEITHDKEHQTRIKMDSGQVLDLNEKTGNFDITDKDGKLQSSFDIDTGVLNSDALTLDIDNPTNASFFGGTMEGDFGSLTYDGMTDYQMQSMESEADAKEETAKTTVEDLIAQISAAQNCGNTGAIMAAGASISAAYGQVDAAVAACIAAGDTGGAATASLLYSSINAAQGTHVNVTSNVNDQNFYGGAIEGDGNLGKALTQFSRNISNPLIQRAIILHNMGREDDPLVKQYYNA